MDEKTPEKVPEQITTHSADATTAWGREFAKRLTAPMLVLLSGDLGSGKTTLTKGIVSGLGAASEDEVTSPTFTLVHVYGNKSQPPTGLPTATTESRTAVGAPKTPASPKVYHADLYRIETFHDFETLGLEDLFETPSIAIFEWSERFPLKSPWPQIHLHLEHRGGDTRRITIT